MAHPQINAIKFRDTFRAMYDANPTAYTTLLIASMLKNMAVSLDKQADQVGAPYSVRLAGTRLRDRIENIISGAKIWRQGLSAWAEIYDVDPRQYFRTALFVAYPDPGQWEDEAGYDDTSKYRGEVWETATFYNQVGAIDNPLNTTYFGDGIQGWIAENMTKAIVTMAEGMGQSDAMNDAIQKWEGFKQYVSTQTEEFTKKAMSPWLWFALGAAAFWWWVNREEDRG